MSEQPVEKKAFDGLVDADLIQVDDDSEAGSEDGDDKQQLAVSERLEPIDAPPIQSWLIKVYIGFLQILNVASNELQIVFRSPLSFRADGRKLRRLEYLWESFEEFVLLVPEDPSNPTPGASSKATSPAPTAASSSTNQAPVSDVKPEEAPMLEYILSESSQAGNLARQKFLYQEDRRRYEFNGTSKRPGKQDCVLARLRLLRKSIPQAIRGSKTRMLTDETLTAGQRNSLATGNSLMRNKNSGLKTALAYSTAKRVDSRALKERSYRMGKQTLIDTLFEEFSRFKFWSMKALKDRLMQPEAWLRECLTEVAQQEQEGPYKSLWTLKPQFAAVQGEADEGHLQAPVDQPISDVARRALESGQDDEGNGDEKKPNAGDDAELEELEGDEDEDMEEVKV
ncbi:hypothetical protein QFC22_001044 [Naganishia vaughanmartiniae]|uniref:Uncharacterized protein n=1 Tax=Naganishia vaughanmartiniae TaxID=1424756 RepID=A0ACC2XLJ0_9TREE|nr:hypothetical protein QFC22_001044 [Naganishia vaughanmartiniae]